MVIEFLPNEAKKKHTSALTTLRSNDTIFKNGVKFDSCYQNYLHSNDCFKIIIRK